MKLNILYEDNHLLVVEKPPFVLSQSDGSDTLDMLSLLKAYVKEKYHKPGNVYLGLVQRRFGIKQIYWLIIIYWKIKNF